MKFFTHTPPIDASSMTRWRHRIGEAGAEELLKETIEAGIKLKAVKPSQLSRVNVDTTVQEKEIRFPTDARLYDRARERLVKEADKRGIVLRQNYNRKSKELLAQQSRYAHARQFSRARACVKKLRTYLGRVIRDIERKCPVPDEQLSSLLSISKRILSQQREDKNKVYSVHEPSVACISKGKAHKRYEFGSKVSLAVTSKGGWVVGALAFCGNPYDGHTLVPALSQVERIGVKPFQAFTDMGYRGHGYVGSVEVHVAKRRRGAIPKSIWSWMRRRSAIEGSIGHMKHEHGLSRNRLKGIEGDKVNVLLSAAGLNFRKLRQFIAAFLRLFFGWLIFGYRTRFLASVA
jgi:IS5 family transposase